jgi:hypothetical protein
MCFNHDQYQSTGFSSFLPNNNYWYKKNWHKKGKVSYGLFYF